MTILFVILGWLVLFLLSCIGHGAGGWSDALTFSSLVWFYDWGARCGFLVGILFPSHCVRVSIGWIGFLDVFLPSLDLSLGELSLFIF